MRVARYRLKARQSAHASCVDTSICTRPTLRGPGYRCSAICRQRCPIYCLTTNYRCRGRETMAVAEFVARPDAALEGPRINAALATDWLVAFLHDELVVRRKIGRAVVGLSGGIDSAVTTYLCARALGPQNVYAFRLPYKTSSASSLADAQLVVDALGIRERTIDISGAVDGYLQHEPDADARRRGNVMARTRMLVLFDQSAKLDALPIGTGNKSERLFGYFTWHGDDSPPINPIGDLFKSQVWDLARHLGVPPVVVDKPATADLIQGQTDEDDLGITYARADRILDSILKGFTPEDIVRQG